MQYAWHSKAAAHIRLSILYSPDSSLHLMSVALVVVRSRHLVTQAAVKHIFIIFITRVLGLTVSIVTPAMAGDLWPLLS